VQDLILHHYPASPFSEKIRMIFGLKNITWKSVTVPDVAPKPDLYPLTGGYRHTPVLQIGADIYCDTKLIVNVIERRYPTPSLWNGKTEGLNRIVEAWAERDLFWPAARFLTGINAQKLGPRFHADRAALRGKKPPSSAGLKRAADRGMSDLKVQLPLLESLLSRDQLYLLGQTPSLADISAYHALWFLSMLSTDCSYVLEPYGNVTAWMKRMCVIGHGNCVEMSSEDAIRCASESDPEPITLPDQVAETHRVEVYPDDAQSNPVEGDLVMRAHNHIAIRRSEPRIGSVVVHFPQLGYIVKEI
jgi:glutathione S-transferase